MEMKGPLFGGLWGIWEWGEIGGERWGMVCVGWLVRYIYDDDTPSMLNLLNGNGNGNFFLGEWEGDCLISFSLFLSFFPPPFSPPVFPPFRIKSHNGKCIV
jgi:hypothetical protein